MYPRSVKLRGRIYPGAEISTGFALNGQRTRTHFQTELPTRFHRYSPPGHCGYYIPTCVFETLPVPKDGVYTKIFKG